MIGITIPQKLFLKRDSHHLKPFSFSACSVFIRSLKLDIQNLVN